MCCICTTEAVRSAGERKPDSTEYCSSDVEARESAPGDVKPPPPPEVPVPPREGAPSAVPPSGEPNLRGETSSLT